MDDQLRDEIVDGLVRRRTRSDIVEGVCNTTGLEWPKAEKLVQQVEHEQAHRIAAGQLPAIAVVSAVMAGAGIFLLAFSLITIHFLIGSDLVLSLAMLATRYRFPAVVGFVGLLAISGSIIGLYQGLLRYFET